jgi:Tfp pilus assembly PilM family ATPase
MSHPLSFNLERWRMPRRRVLALDGGSRRLKLLLAESDFGHVRILKQEMVDLAAEGLVSSEEVQSHVRNLLSEYGEPPLAVVLPQHIAISQLVDLPPAAESEVEKLIADEALKLGGVSESRIVYDFVRTEPSTGKGRPQFWVTRAQEGEIRERLARLGVEHEDLCELTTSANALIAAFRVSSPRSSRAILVHMGAQTTVVVVLLDGHGVFATSFQMGGDFFTRTLARVKGCGEEVAEGLKRSKNFLAGPEASADFAAAVEGWVTELKGQLNDWFQANPALLPEVGSFALVASGGGFELPGLFEYLRGQQGLVIEPWHTSSGGLENGFEVALGTALQALRLSPQPVSLLPDDYRQAWRKRLSRQRVEMASFGLVVACILLLAVGTWHKLALINTKTALWNKVKEAQTAVDANDSLSAELTGEYESLRPIFAAQQNTVDTLKTLALLQQTRSNRSFWYVLLADQQSYFSAPPPALSTNRPSKTNTIGAALDPGRVSPLAPRLAQVTATNVALAKPGFIAELCAPGEADAARQVLSELVNGLKQQPLFSKVDLLSDDLRRSLAEPKVVVPDRDFVLALDFAETDFQQPVQTKKPSPRPPRRAARWAPSSGETEPQLGQNIH